MILVERILVWGVYKMIFYCVCILFVFFFKFFILSVKVVISIVFLVEVYEGDVINNKFGELW